MLFLEGAYISSVNHSDIPQIDDYQVNIDNYHVYDKIPKYFFDMSTWPPTTELQCINCDRVCHSWPIPLPSKKIRVEDKIGFSIEYVGCSFSCVMRHIKYVIDDKLENNNVLRRRELSELLKEVHEKFTGNKIEEIPCALPKTVMKQYGGYMTPHEYEQNLVI